MSEIRRIAYTREESAKALGVSVCTIDRLIRKKVIRGSRVLGRTLIAVSELEKLLNYEYLSKVDGRKTNGRKPKNKPAGPQMPL